MCDEGKVIINSRYKPLVYHIEVADTYAVEKKPDVQEVHRTSWNVIYFEKAQHVHMWMKNTEINLDIIFVNNSGIITQIIRNASPMSEKIYSSNVQVKYVLEFLRMAKMFRPLRLGIQSHMFLKL